MQETGNNIRKRLTIRIGRNSMSFSTMDTDCGVKYEPYTVKSGISMAANLREAFRNADLLAENFQRVQVMVDAPALMVPVDLFEEGNKEVLYQHAFPNRPGEAVLYNVLPDLSCVAVFSVNKDLKTVIDDHFGDVRFFCAASPVWRHLHQRSFTGVRNKLYGYFHDQELEIFSFNQNRFKYCNSFEVSHAHDALYFLLYVWKQLQLKPEHDEMHIAGDIPEKEWMLSELRRYLQRAYAINPTGEFNRAPVTQIKGIPYDLMTLYAKGR